MYHKGETTDKFIVCIHKQAHHCKFGAALDKRSMFHVKLKKKLLEINKITLEATMIKFESARPHVSKQVRCLYQIKSLEQALV